jgi:hypothetical protein
MKRILVAALLVFLATVAGVAGGLYYAWMIAPIRYHDSAPNDLYAPDRLTYLALIGDHYALNSDLEQAKAAMSELGIDADGQVLAGLIEDYLDGGGQPEDVRNLARLAQDLGARGGVLLVFDLALSPTPTPALTLTPSVPADALPTQQALTVVPEPEFLLVEQTQLCAEPGEPGKIAITVRDTQGNQLPGVEVVVSWPQGQDRFFTGLLPGMGAGYADFQMSSGTEYEVALVGFRGDAADQLVSDLEPGLCPTGTLAADWHLTFETQP